MTDHVVIDAKKAGAMCCLHCGEEQAVAYPINLTVWLAANAAFLKLHRRCKKPAEVAKP